MKVLALFVAFICLFSVFTLKLKNNLRQDTQDDKQEVSPPTEDQHTQYDPLKNKLKFDNKSNQEIQTLK
jgi:hypothetical protein